MSQSYPVHRLVFIAESVFKKGRIAQESGRKETAQLAAESRRSLTLQPRPLTGHRERGFALQMKRRSFPELVHFHPEPPEMKINA